MGLSPQALLPRQGWLSLTLLLLLVGAMLRFYQLDSKSLWGDEIIQVIVARESLEHILTWTGHDWGPTPLSYFLVHGWLRLVGESEFALRVLPVFVGVLSLPLQYQMGQRLLGKESALLGITLLVLSPLHLFYSQELRPYMLFLGWVLLAVLSFWRALYHEGPGPWVLTGVLVGSGFYNHQYLLVLLGVLLPFALLLAVSPEARRELSSGKRQVVGPSRLIYGMILLLGTTGLLIAPWYLRVEALVGGAPWATVGLGIDFFRESGGIVVEALLSNYLPLTIILGIGWLSGLMILFRSSWPVALFLAGWTLLPLLFFIAIDVWRDYIFVARQVIMSLPPFCLVSARGLLFLSEQARTLPTGATRVALLSGLLALCSIVPLLEVYQNLQGYQTSRADWRLIGRFLSGAVGENEVILAPDTSRYIDYYYDGAAILREEGSSDSMQKLLDEHEGLWLVWSEVDLGFSPAIKQQVENFLAGKQGVEVFADSQKNKIYYFDRSGRSPVEVHEWLRRSGKLYLP